MAEQFYKPAKERKMFKKVFIIAVLSVLGMNLLAGFPEDFQNAAKLYRKRKNQEAYEAFMKLAGTAPSKPSKAECLKFAAMSLGNQKKYDQAMELAKSIKLKPVSVYTQMEIMNKNRKFKELVEAFRKEEISSWPDKFNYKGFKLRGIAYAQISEPEKALKDFEQSSKLAGSDLREKFWIINNIASLYNKLGNNKKAKETYRMALELYDANPSLKSWHCYPRALLDLSAMVKKENKLDEAVAILDRFKFYKKRSSWDCLILEAYGDIYSEQGKDDIALKKYKEAVVIKTHKSFIKRISKKIDTLKKRAKNNE